MVQPQRWMSQSAEGHHQYQYHYHQYHHHCYSRRHSLDQPALHTLGNHILTLTPHRYHLALALAISGTTMMMMMVMMTCCTTAQARRARRGGIHWSALCHPHLPCDCSTGGPSSPCRCATRPHGPLDRRKLPWADGVWGDERRRRGAGTVVVVVDSGVMPTTVRTMMTEEGSRSCAAASAEVWCPSEGDSPRTPRRHYCPPGHYCLH